MSDLINRSALLEDIKATVRISSRDGLAMEYGEIRGAKKVLQRIEAAPAVDAVPVVHGRYKKSDYCDEWFTNYFSCQECGYKFMVTDEEGYETEPHWCPNCVASYGERKDE